MKRFRTAGRGRGFIPVALSATLIAGAACSSVLKDDDSGLLSGTTLEAWPDLDPAGEATTPVHPEVTLAAQPVVRTAADGLATLTIEVDNRGNEDVTAGDLFAYSGSDVPGIVLYDSEGNVAYGPVSIDREEDSGACLCSSPNVTVPAGEARSLYATYEGLPEDVESVRVQINRFTPINDIPVEHAEGFRVAADQPALMESDPDLQVTLTSVTPHEEGTLVKASYTNVGRNEPVELTAFPEPRSLKVASSDGDALFLVRSDGDEAFAATDLAGTDEPLARGESFDVELLVAPLPASVDAVFVRAPGLRRTLPIPVTDPDGDDGEPGTFTIPRNLEDPRIRTLASRTARYSTPMVPTEPPDLPPVNVVGGELPQVDVTRTLTSEAQPEWSVGVRGVVRGPGEYATLLLDVHRGDTGRTWPEGVGVGGSRSNLGAVSVIDPGAGKRYGVLTSGRAAFSAGDSWWPRRETTMPAYAILPGDAAQADEVTVDVPAFGTVEDVPVVDGPTEPGRGDVKATMRVRGNDNLRMDILTVSRLEGGNGTLVRARLVNESDPAAVETMFGNEGRSNLCDLKLYDPATHNRYPALEPCAATTWSDSLAQGEELVYEVRFPELPGSVETVVAAATGYFPSGPVGVTDGDRPWYLALPAPADDPDGSTYVASVGDADRGATSTRTEDTVEIVLETDVLFEFDSAELTPEAERRVADLAADIAATARPGTITITGHTDNVGSDDYNQGLSGDRAEAVRAVLEPAVDRSDITFEVNGRGSRDPVAPNEIDGRPNPDGQERNRRVEIKYQTQ